MMPSSIPAWKDALIELSQLHDEPREGVNSGYALPDPGLLVSPQNDETKASYFSTWLKVHDVMIHRIHASRPSVDPIANRHWRHILGLQKTTVTDGTKEARVRQTLLKVLQDASKLAETEIDFEKLAFIPAVWRGIEMPPNRLPELHIAKQILWELYEINFRLEFTSMDSVLCKSGELREDRQILIDNLCWYNGTITPDWDSSDKGLNAKDLLARAEQLSGLHTIMSSWSGPRPPSLLKPFPKVSESDVGQLEQVERELASFYVQSFFRIFGRAAMTPHHL